MQSFTGIQCTVTLVVMNEAGGTVVYMLQTIKLAIGEAVKDRVAVVKTREYRCMNN